ncbi:unnamed protein product [Arabidopsis thaliana]|uniref:Uncharacterized protein n=1 Tax=Arabidopsis thaliana TaxID=3702 RepID=A0A654G6W1_ARATH|nr:unnamed protein product [Arabidopsis thaliana]
MVQVVPRVVEESSTGEALDEMMVMVNRQSDVEKGPKVEILIGLRRTSRNFSSTRMGVKQVLSSGGFRGNELKQLW